MTWQEKSITVDPDSEYLFKSVLGDVKIDQSGIHRDDLKNKSDWKKIRKEMDDEEIFYGYLAWDEIASVSKKEEYLTFPHIDIEINEQDQYGDNKKLMIFFKEDTPSPYDQIDAFFKTVQKMWNAYRQRNKLHSLNYSYQDSTHRLEPGEEGEKSQKDEEEDEQQEQTEEQEEDKQENSNSVSNIIDQALNSPSDLMDKFGN